MIRSLYMEDALPRISSCLCAVLVVAFAAACTDHPATPTDTPSVAGASSRGEVRSGYIVGRDGRPLKVTFEVLEGRAIFEGDIDLGPAESIPTTPDAVRNSNGPRYGVVVDGHRQDGSLFRWPGGIVPYEIDPSLPASSRVHDAIAAIEAATVGIRFVPRTSQADYIRVVPGPQHCWSSVGRVGGSQEVRLEIGCGTQETIHELGHALGMWHEQSRCDRDDYVEILWSNIDPTYHYAFEKKCDSASDFGPYDEGSIMHYLRYAFSINQLPTIRSKRGLDWKMDQKNGLTPADVFTLQAIYPPSQVIHRLRNPNWYGGDHLYGPDPNEGRSAGFLLEGKNYFYLTSAVGSRYAPLYRCNANNHHYLSRSASCEVGVSPEAALGQIATSQVSGTVPLYRTRDPWTGHRLSTHDATERQNTLNSGWVDEGVTGYVWVRTPIHRLYNPAWSGGDHLYSHDPAEGRSAGYALETQNFFYVTSVSGPGYASLWRCNVGNHHYLSRDRYCEAGVSAEAEMGLIATSQIAGTVPLYRLRNPWNGDRLSTTHLGERQNLLNGGWINEGITAYVWDQP